MARKQPDLFEGKLIRKGAAVMTLFARLPREQAELYRLVLTAEQIACRLESVDGHWRIRVQVADAPRARRVIALYIAENPPLASPPPVPGETTEPFTLTGVVAAALLVAVFVATGTRENGTIFIDRYSAAADLILDGEVYRTVTALLLHGDAVHLLGNCVALIVFGTAAANQAGWGVAWVMILWAGGMGNFANALFYQSGHRSIGASTAVFGAVGILACLQAMERNRQRRGHFGGWLPIAAGLGLLAFFGASPFSDVTAHLFGFGAGLLMAAAGHSVLPRLDHPRLQAAALMVVVATLSYSWTAGW